LEVPRRKMECQPVFWADDGAEPFKGTGISRCATFRSEFSIARVQKLGKMLKHLLGVDCASASGGDGAKAEKLNGTEAKLAEGEELLELTIRWARIWH
jgi:hypothetical protein